MSNFKNALKLQELIEENANLKHEVSKLNTFQKIDKGKIESMKVSCKENLELIDALSSQLERAMLERNELRKEVNILKDYFKLKL